MVEVLFKAMGKVSSFWLPSVRSHDTFYLSVVQPVLYRFFRPSAHSSDHLWSDKHCRARYHSSSNPVLEFLRQRFKKDVGSLSPLYTYYSFWCVFDISIFDDITLHSASTISGIDAKNTEFAFLHTRVPNCVANCYFILFFTLPAGSGWDIYRSDDVTITNSQITNQDDCVSFKPNSTNVLVQNLICNGSHGISVGFILCYRYPRAELKLASDRLAVLVNVCCSPSL
jgi:hypothetical protein